MFKKVFRRVIADQKFNFVTLQNQQKMPELLKSSIDIPEPVFDEDFICNPSNRDFIKNNVNHRKGVGDIDKILELKNKPGSREIMLKAMLKLPNLTDPRVLEYGEQGKVLKEVGERRNFDFTPQTFESLAKTLDLIRTENLGPVAGSKSYVLFNDLAQMEEALIQYTVRHLMKLGFKLVSVPDILPTKIIERCGLVVDGERHLIYNLDKHYGDLSLSGTAEMALAMKLMNCKINVADFPLKLAAVSRCYRAEVSHSAEEHGIYRVHQFTKVEMFGCTDEHRSSEFLDELQSIQESMFTNLGLHFRVVDMPSHELGSPAYRKIDIEGWLPGRNDFGELTSCSNCTDYQSRRLNIRYENDKGDLKFVHTLNGTACAIPRTIIAICETFQTSDGNIQVPDKLVPFMNNKKLIEKQTAIEMRNYKQSKFK